MSTNPYEPPQEVNEANGNAFSPWHVVKETLSAFGCLGAAILAILAAFLVVGVLGGLLKLLLQPFFLPVE